MKEIISFARFWIMLLLFEDLPVDTTNENCFGITFVNRYLCPKLFLLTIKLESFK